MSSRLELHQILVGLLGTNNVYFQPPSTVKMKYPCIIYQCNGDNVHYADNVKYNRRIEYTVTSVDLDPDSLIPNKISALDYCSYDRHFIVDNLNHEMFTLFF